MTSTEEVTAKAYEWLADRDLVDAVVHLATVMGTGHRDPLYTVVRKHHEIARQVLLVRIEKLRRENARAS